MAKTTASTRSKSPIPGSPSRKGQCPPSRRATSPIAEPLDAAKSSETQSGNVVKPATPTPQKSPAKSSTQSEPTTFQSSAAINSSRPPSSGLKTASPKKNLAKTPPRSSSSNAQPKPKKNAHRSPQPHELEPRQPAGQAIADLDALREKALAAIGNAFLNLLPDAIVKAKSGKPAQLRLIARWFRMPNPAKKSEIELSRDLEEANRRLSAAGLETVGTTEVIWAIDDRGQQ